MTAAGSLPSHSSPSSLILPLVDSSVSESPNPSLSMETNRDYSSVATDASNHASLEYSIVHSPPFTFLVGPRHTKLTVQSGLARHVSKPLDHLMNSGQTRESKHHTAVLEDEDVETFVAFCEYAYTGDYSVPPPGARQDDREPVSPVTRPAFQRCFTAESVLSPSDHAYLPSPPRSAEAEKDSDRHVAVDEVRSREEPKAVGGEDVKGNGISHESAALEESRTGEAPVSEERGGQLATDAPDGDVEPWEMAGDAAPSKGKKGKKKDKKKQKEDMQVDDLNTKLTPPTTPPPDNLRDGEARDDTPERDERANEESPFESAAEQAATSPSQGMEDGWEESPGSTTPSGNDTTTPDPETADQGEEDGNQEVERSMGPIIDTSFAKQHFSHHEKGTSMWDEFASLNYIDPRGYSSTRPPSVLSTQSSRAELPYLVFHAKLYVFAARYLIPALAQLCLRKLHRDLVNLGFPDGDGPSDRNADDDEAASLTTTKAKMVLDLLHYTYTKTTRLEPISPAAATQLRDNELRKLVIHYAACKVRDLAECCPPMEGDFSSLRYPVKPSDRGMRALLDVTPELASDLVYRMM